MRRSMCFCLSGLLLIIVINAFGQKQDAIKIEYKLSDNSHADTTKIPVKTALFSKLKLLKEFEHKTAARENDRLKASIANVQLQRNSLIVGIIIAIGIAILVGLRNSQKNPEQMAATASAIDGDALLSEREKEILQFLVKGLSYKQIAAECNITYSTVRFHMGNIYSKLQVSSMTEAVAKALQQKLV